MPDLGKYAANVLAAYGASLSLLVLLVGLSLRRGLKVRRELRRVEKPRNG